MHDLGGGGVGGNLHPGFMVRWSKLAIFDHDHGQN